MKLKKGDRVLVIAGKDKGREGKIEKVLAKVGKVLIPGVNVYKKHLKPRKEGQSGGIIDIVKPLPVANVAFLCPKCSQRTRIGYKIDKKGGKYRICRKCQTII